MKHLLSTVVLLFGLVQPAPAQNNVSITTTQTQRCVEGDGLPDHPTGEFPSRGNPNAIAAQQVKMCMTSSPERSNQATPIRGAIGIAVNGVQFRPTTAGFYDPNGRRGHGRNGDRNWSLDMNNGHVGPNGLYHYHGIAKSLTETSGSSLVGYAGDGFEIHYVGTAAQSGYRLKQGTRPSGPGGSYDGTYNEDYEFVEDAGNLDQCNGGMLNGQFVYFVTETYPFVGRCLWGPVSPDFGRNRH